MSETWAKYLLYCRHPFQVHFLLQVNELKLNLTKSINCIRHFSWGTLRKRSQSTMIYVAYYVHIFKMMQSLLAVIKWNLARFGIYAGIQRFAILLQPLFFKTVLFNSLEASYLEKENHILLFIKLLTNASNFYAFIIIYTIIIIVVIYCFNSLALGRFQFNFRLAIFKLILVNAGRGIYLLQNCPQMNTTRPYWW